MKSSAFHIRNHVASHPQNASPDKIEGGGGGGGHAFLLEELVLAFLALLILLQNFNDTAGACQVMPVSESKTEWAK